MTHVTIKNGLFYYQDELNVKCSFKHHLCFDLPEPCPSHAVADSPRGANSHPSVGRNAKCQFWIKKSQLGRNNIWIWKSLEKLYQHPIVDHHVLAAFHGRHTHVFLQGCLTNTSTSSASWGFEKQCMPPNPIRRYNSWDINNSDIQGIFRRTPSQDQSVGHAAKVSEVALREGVESEFSVEMFQIVSA